MSKQFETAQAQAAFDSMRKDADTAFGVTRFHIVESGLEGIDKLSAQVTATAERFTMLKEAHIVAHEIDLELRRLASQVEMAIQEFQAR